MVQVVGVSFLKGSVTCPVLFNISFIICVMNFKILMKIVDDTQLKGVIEHFEDGTGSDFRIFWINEDKGLK